jgi:hypothetical protein
MKAKVPLPIELEWQWWMCWTKEHITQGLSLSLNNDSKIQAALVLCFD